MSIEKLRAQLSILILVVLQVLQASDKKYVVETSTQVVERCMLMTTDPGDLVLDPTCGSGEDAALSERLEQTFFRD